MKLIAAAVAALTLLAGTVSMASANEKAEVDVRVVTWKEEILVDRSVVAQTTTVPTSSRALCFGGTPTDGSRTIPGTSALGALQRVTAGVPDLRPLLLTNAFDFGLGVCAVGTYAPVAEEWWALKVNGALATSGGDSTFLKPGDRVLWYLDRSYSAPVPDELRLLAPASVRRGSVAAVRVLAFDGEGRSRPAGGVRVFAGPDFVGTTDSSGRIGVRINAPTRLVARLSGLIPSNRWAVGMAKPNRQSSNR